MKKLFVALFLLVAINANAAIKAFVTIREIRIVAGNIQAQVEIQPVVGPVQVTTVTAPASGLTAGSIIPGLKKLIIAFAAASVDIAQTWLPEEIYILSGGRDANNTITLNGVQPVVWTNQPAAITALAGSTVQLDLTIAQQVRFVSNVITAGFAGARIGAQYSLDGSTNWRFFDGATGPNVLIDTTGPKQSAWIDLETAAKAVVFIRVGGQGGNATADPAFGLTFLEVR